MGRGSKQDGHVKRRRGGGHLPGGEEVGEGGADLRFVAVVVGAVDGPVPRPHRRLDRVQGQPAGRFGWRWACCSCKMRRRMGGSDSDFVGGRE